MSSRRKAYRRCERVLASDKMNTSREGIEALKSELTSTLSEYMNVYDMYVSFKRLEGNRYALKVESVVDGLLIPSVMR